jgi:hypothetical protein
MDREVIRVPVQPIIIERHHGVRPIVKKKTSDLVA